jgi:zinc finger protein
MAEMTLEGQACPMCMKKTLTLAESQTEVPFFGNLVVFSMSCTSCHYHKADCEAGVKRDPAKYSMEINSPEDMTIRVVKSSDATVKIAHLGSILPGSASSGYVTNIEGIINRMKRQIESLKASADDSTQRKKAKNLLKKIINIKSGEQPCKIILEDPTGNSAIISDKATVSKMRKK